MRDIFIAPLLIMVISAYRRFVSPLIGECCRFHPTCSEYAILAIRKHGTTKGSWLACKRLLRCQPFCEGGFDYVPEK